MANQFLDLPLPAGDGAGASVDTSGFGKDKTIVVDGNFPGATITIQVSVDGGTVFQNLVTFSGSGKRVIPVAAQFMRTFVQGRSAAPFSANVDVGSNDIGGAFADMVIPAADGVGASVDISALGNFTTMIAGGEFRNATLTLEISQDDVSFVPAATFNHPGGICSKELIANYARVRVSGREGNTFPFTPTLSLGATNDSSSGGIGATGNTLITDISGGEGETHGSQTPLVVAQFEFNPTDFDFNNTTRTLQFRAVAASSGINDVIVELYNLTDGETITQLTFDSATPSLMFQPLTEGPNENQIDQSSKIYEVRIWVDSGEPASNVELGSASLRVINTVD